MPEAVQPVSSCKDAHEKGAMPVAEVQAQLRALLQPHGRRETLALHDVIPGRVLAEPLTARLRLPATALSAMDGYALDWHSTMQLSAGHVALEVAGTSRAGTPWQGRSLAPGQCIRIYTGAVLPEACDTVIMQEQTREIGQGHIDIDLQDSRQGENVRQAGEECQPGDVLLPAGHRIRASDIGLMAAQGVESVEVSAPLSISLFTTGDELCTPGTPLQAGQIYDSNRFVLKALLQSAGWQVHDMGILADDTDAIAHAMHEAAAHSDVIISTGGVSVGDHDHVRPALEKAGRLTLWKMAIKPGRPLTYGRIGNSHFFGLPGNPAAVMTTCHQIILPALRQLEGEIPPADHLSFGVKSLVNLRKRPGRTEFLRGHVLRDEDGNMVVTTTGNQSSGILRSFAMANCFIVLPAESSGIQQGEIVEIQPFHGCMSHF